MSLLHIGSFLYIQLVVVLKITYAVGTECLEIYCYNGGSMRFENGLCVCHCPPGVTGILCGQEMKTSKWPHGLYALPMPGDGCPEDNDRGWEIGRMRIATRYPLTDKDSYKGCENETYKYQTGSEFQNDSAAHITGYFDTYELQINLCYKLPQYTSNQRTRWPTGNYSIYGVNYECPSDFYAENMTICLPPTRSLEQHDSLPVFSIMIDKNLTNLQFTICTRRQEDHEVSSEWSQEHPFALVKLPEKNCQDIGGFVSSQNVLSSTLPFSQRWLLSEQPFMFCFYKPYTYIVGGTTDYGEYNDNTTLRETLTDFHGMMYVTLNLEHISCEDKPKGFPSSNCDGMQKLTIDAEIAVGISGILFQFDNSISKNNFRNRHSSLYIFTSNKRIYTTVSDAIMCTYNEYSLEISDTDLVVVLLCNRSILGRFVTIYTQDDIPSNTFVTILSELPTNTSDTSESGVTSCYSDMGMSSNRINDLQLEASTSLTSHEPHQARPNNNGWCANLHDLQPYLQVDFISASMIEGIMLYSWMEIETNMYQNLYNYSLREYGRQSFILEYAVTMGTFIRFNREPWPIDLTNKIDEPHIYLFQTPFFARYLRVYPLLEDDKLTPTCLKLEILGCQRGIHLAQLPVYFDLFNGNLSNVYTTNVMVNESFHLENIDVSVTASTNQIFRWNILATTKRFLLLQFTDISLRPTETGPLFKNNDFCKEVLVVTRNDIPTRQVSTDHDLDSVYVFDHRHNGRFPTVPVQDPIIALEFRSCIQSQAYQGQFRGFSVSIFEKDTHPPCFQNKMCLQIPSIIGSPSFLGQLLEYYIIYTWTFVQVFEPNSAIRILDFDVSCNSGTTFIIRDMIEFTQTMYCNKNRSYDAIPTNSQKFNVVYHTERLSCGQILFREGFRLSFERAQQDNNINILGWTSNQSEFEEKLPISIVVHSLPESRKDIRASLPNNGTVRKVCSDHFEKCYTLYIGLPGISTDDAMRLCGDRNMTLVNFRTKSEMEYVREIVLQRLRDMGFLTVYKSYGNLNLLIGLLRYAIGNKYRNYWSDGSIAEFTAWDEMEPYNEGKRLCTRMKLADKGGWKTETCTGLKNSNIVCEQLMPSELNSPKGENKKSNFNVEKTAQPFTYEVKVSETNSTLTIYNHLLFACNNGEFVSRLARCNGIGECLDNSDEEGYLKDGECEKDEFKCDESRCIHISQVCDHVYDCNDFTDEACTYKQCKNYEFMCDGGVCHHKEEICDAIKHCKDGTDEINCEKQCGSRRSPGCGLIKICLPDIFTCNGVVDCPDGTDELGCKTAMKTCDDILISSSARNGTYKSGDKYISCEFDMHSKRGRVLQYMTLLNVDWLFKKKAEYNLEPYGFVKIALQNGYTCSQTLTKEARRDIQMVNTLLNKTDNDWEQIHLNLIILNTNNSYSIASTDTFEVILTENDLQLRLYDNFDIENNRITLGPIQCYKESSIKPIISCGDGVRPVDEDMRCVYNVDAELNDFGCVNLNHLDNCTDFVCPDQLIKCPRSYCIHPHKICDGFMDCPQGEDEDECFCEDDKKTFVIFSNMYAEDDYIHMACKLAGELYSRGRTILVIRYRADIMNVLYGQLMYSKAGHCLYKDGFEYNVDLNPNFLNWNSWPLNSFQKFYNVFQNSKSNVLIWMTKSELDDRENAISNFIKKYTESFSGNTTVYNVRADPTIQSTVKKIPSAVTEILVRKWKIINGIGPLLFRDECRSTSKSTCKQGYRCLRSRVCIQIEQLCDGRQQCPHGDDEMNCDFRCPRFCSCGLLTMKCKVTMNNIDLKEIPDTARILDLSGSKGFGIVFIGLYRFVMPFSYLISLNMSNCNISTISYENFLPFKNLKTLDLSYNRIPQLTEYVFSNLTRLTQLLLNGNSFLSYVEPWSLHGLKIQSLDLSGCGIISLSMNTFVDLSLDNIDLSFNEIDKIEDSAFNRLSTRNLNLRGNKISVFSKRMFDGINSLEQLQTPAYKFCCIRPIYMKEESCLPYKDEFSSCADLMRNPILQALLWIIGSLALIGNISSLVYRIYSKDKLKIGYGIFVTNLAVSDMLMGVYMLIIAVADSIFRGRYIEVDTYWRSSNWCRLAGVLSTMSSEASVFFIACITIDRILVIKFPFGNVRLTARKAIVVSVVIWICVMVLSILPLLYVKYFSDNFYSKSAVCLALPLTRDRPPGWIYSISLFIAFNFVMFVLIALGQLMIYLEIQKQARKRSKRMNVTRRNDLKVARNLLLLVSTDFLCWFPIGLMGLMAIDGYMIPGVVYAWTAVLILPINSALNPFLYTLSAILNRKSFNPNTDEQEHEDTKTEFAHLFVRISSFFPSRKKRHEDVNLSSILIQRSLIKEEVLLIVMHIAKGLSFLHEENLVMKKLDAKIIGIRLSSDMVRMAYFNKSPQVLIKKGEKAEDIYHFGALVGECIKSLTEK